MFDLKCVVLNDKRNLIVSPKKLFSTNIIDYRNDSRTISMVTASSCSGQFLYF